MILIFGGAYQGKLDFAKETFSIAESDIYMCQENTDLDMSAKVLCNLEQMVLGCVKENIEAKDILTSYKDEIKDKLIIVNDISQGIVPIDPVMRAWREMVGRTMLYLAKEADEVYRVFCGIGEQIK